MPTRNTAEVLLKDAVPNDGIDELLSSTTAVSWMTRRQIYHVLERYASRTRSGWIGLTGGASFAPDGGGRVIRRRLPAAEIGGRRLPGCDSIPGIVTCAEPSH
jgi:hypothetical protein